MKIIKDIISFTNRFIQKYRNRMILYCLAGMILYLITSLIPITTGAFIDELDGDIQTQQLITIGLVFLGLNLLQILLCYYVKIEGTKISIGASNKMKATFFMHMQMVSPLNNRIDDPAALADRVNNSCEYLIMFLCNLGMQFPGKLVSLFVIYVYIAIKSWQLAAVAILAIPVLVYFHKRTRDVIYETSFESEKARNHFFSVMYEQLGHLSMIRTHAVFSFMQDRLIRAGKQLLETNIEQERKEFKYALFGQNTDVFLKLFLFAFGAVSLIKGHISIGTFTVLFSYLSILSDNLSYFINVSQEAYQYKAFLDRLKEIDGQKKERVGTEIINGIDRITVNGLDFAYKDGDPLYKNYSKAFEKGKIYGFIGDNGAGKTTLVKILLGLFTDDTDNSIFYDDQPIRAIDIYDARNHLVGVCEQEPEMLDDTLLNNLLYDRTKKPDVGEFHKICSSLDLFQENEDSFEDIMQRNALELSGGQKQKFALARAIYKNPSLLMLDEPTSALDKSGVIALKRLLQRIKSEMIIIMITHDPQMMDIVDETVVIA